MKREKSFGKKFLALLLAVLMVASLLPATALAAEVTPDDGYNSEAATGEPSTNDGDSPEPATLEVTNGTDYAFNTDTGELTITSDNGLANFWKDQGGSTTEQQAAARALVKSVIFSGKINPTATLQDCINLEKVRFDEANGDAAHSIQTDMFRNCEKLTSVVCPKTLNEIKTGAFLGTGLTELTIYYSRGSGGRNIDGVKIDSFETTFPESLKKIYVPLAILPDYRAPEEGSGENNYIKWEGHTEKFKALTIDPLVLTKDQDQGNWNQSWEWDCTTRTLTLEYADIATLNSDTPTITLPADSTIRSEHSMVTSYLDTKDQVAKEAAIECAGKLTIMPMLAETFVQYPSLYVNKCSEWENTEMKDRRITSDVGVKATDIQVDGVDFVVYARKTAIDCDSLFVKGKIDKETYPLVAPDNCFVAFVSYGGTALEATGTVTLSNCAADSNISNYISENLYELGEAPALHVGDLLLENNSIAGTIYRMVTAWGEEVFVPLYYTVKMDHEKGTLCEEEFGKPAARVELQDPNIAWLAKVGKQYLSLDMQTATQTVQNGETIKLLRGLTEDDWFFLQADTTERSFTLDLNSQTIPIASPVMNDGTGTMTITDTTGSGTLTVESSNEAAFQSQNGTIALTGGTIIAKGALPGDGSGGRSPAFAVKSLDISAMEAKYNTGTEESPVYDGETYVKDNKLYQGTGADADTTEATDVKLTSSGPSISVGSQTGNAGYGTSATVTYPINSLNFSESTTFVPAVQWKNGDIWNDAAPEGVTATWNEEKTTLTLTTTEAVNAGSYTFKVVSPKETEGEFYASAEATLTVNKATYSGVAITKTISQQANQEGKTGTLTAAEMTDLLGAKITAITGSSTNVVTAAPVLADGTLTYSTKNVTLPTKDTYTVTIATTNYDDISAELTFSVAAKTEVAVDVTGVTLTGATDGKVTYTGNGMAYTGKASAPNVDADNGFADTWYKKGTDNNWTKLDAAPKDVGSYKLVISIKEDNADYQGSGEIAFTIEPKALTVTGMTATNRAYNGTTDVVLAGGTLDGTVGGDDVTFTAPTTGTIADKTVGDNKSVTLLPSPSAVTQRVTTPSPSLRLP